MIIQPEDDLKQCRFAHENILKDLEQLDQEKNLLSAKIDELIDAEQQLLVRITNTLYLRKKRNEELRERVKLLQSKCNELSEFLQRISYPY